jgi:hypothetical protein
MTPGSGRSALATIIKGWLVAGTLDISSAFLHYYYKTGKNPFKVLNYVAGGIFGKEAFTGGNGMAVTGLLLHYFIALCWTVLFFFLYPALISRMRSTVLTGLVYGIFVWAFMNFVVVRLSALPQPPFVLSNAVVAMLIIMFAVGIPLSIIISKYYRDKKIKAAQT